MVKICKTRKSRSMWVAAVAVTTMLVQIFCAASSSIVRAEETLVPGAAQLPNGFNLSFPFPSPLSVQINAGYNDTSRNHVGVHEPAPAVNRYYALDFTVFAQTTEGKNVLAAASGTVRAIGACSDAGCCDGNRVIIEHAANVWTLYAHLASVEPTLSVGDSVIEGLRVGIAGKSGCFNSSSFLHFAVVTNASITDGSLVGGKSTMPQRMGRYSPFEPSRVGYSYTSDTVATIPAPPLNPTTGVVTTGAPVGCDVYVRAMRDTELREKSSPTSAVLAPIPEGAIFLDKLYGVTFVGDYTFVYFNGTTVQSQGFVLKNDVEYYSYTCPITTTTGQPVIPVDSSSATSNPTVYSLIACSVGLAVSGGLSI